MAHTRRLIDYCGRRCLSVVPTSLSLLMFIWFDLNKMRVPTTKRLQHKNTFYTILKLLKWKFSPSFIILLYLMSATFLRQYIDIRIVFHIRTASSLQPVPCKIQVKSLLCQFMAQFMAKLLYEVMWKKIGSPKMKELKITNCSW